MACRASLALWEILWSWCQLDGVGSVAGCCVRNRAAAVRAGTLPVPTYRLGRLIMVGEPLSAAPASAGQVVVYARVSSAGQRADLDRQVARVTGWVTGKGLAVDRVVTGVRSALDGHREKFLALLRDPVESRIVVRAAANRARRGVAAVTGDETA